MDKLNHMIVEVKKWREIHRTAFYNGDKNRSIDAAACTIREIALLDAKRAIENSQKGRGF